MPERKRVIFMPAETIVNEGNNGRPSADGGGASLLSLAGYFSLCFAGCLILFFVIYMPCYFLPLTHIDDQNLYFLRANNMPSDLKGDVFFAWGRPVIWLLAKFINYPLVERLLDLTILRALSLVINCLSAAALACFFWRGLGQGKTDSWLFSALIFTLPGYQYMFFQGSCVCIAIVMFVSTLAGIMWYFAPVTRGPGVFSLRLRGWRDILPVFFSVTLLMLCLYAYQGGAFLFFLPFALALAVDGGQGLAVKILRMMGAVVVFAVAMFAGAALYAFAVMPLARFCGWIGKDCVFSFSSEIGGVSPVKVAGYLACHSFGRFFNLWFVAQPCFSVCFFIVAGLITAGVALEIFRARRGGGAVFATLVKYILTAAVVTAVSLPAALVNYWPVSRAMIFQAAVVLCFLVFSVLSLMSLLPSGGTPRAKTLALGLFLLLGCVMAEKTILLSAANNIIQFATLRQSFVSGLKNGGNNFTVVSDVKGVSFLGGKTSADEFNVIVPADHKNMSVWLSLENILPERYLVRSGSFSYNVISREDYREFPEIFHRNPSRIFYSMSYNYVRDIDSELLKNCPGTPNPVLFCSASSGTAAVRNIFDSSAGADSFWRAEDNAPVPQVIDFEYRDDFYPESVIFYDSGRAAGILPEAFTMEIQRSDGKWVSLPNYETVTASFDKGVRKTYFGICAVRGRRLRLIITKFQPGMKTVGIGKMTVSAASVPFFRGAPVTDSPSGLDISVPSGVLDRSGCETVTAEGRSAEALSPGYLTVTSAGCPYYPQRLKLFGGDIYDKRRFDLVDSFDCAKFCGPDFSGTYIIGGETGHRKYKIEIPGLNTVFPRYSAGFGEPVTFGGALGFALRPCDEPGSESLDGAAEVTIGGAPVPGGVAGLNKNGWVLKTGADGEARAGVKFKAPVSVKGFSLQAFAKDLGRAPAGLEIYARGRGGEWLRAGAAGAFNFLPGNGFMNTLQMRNLIKTSEYMVVFRSGGGTDIVFCRLEFDSSFK
jgi:hypothetical protein